MASMLGVESSDNLIEWSDEQLDSMMFQIIRNATERSGLGEAKLTRLEQLEAEWARRKHLPNFMYLR